MGYDPAQSETHAPIRRANYVGDYHPPRVQARLEMGIEQARALARRDAARRTAITKEAHADIQRWEAEGRSLREIVVDLYLLLDAATRKRA